MLTNVICSGTWWGVGRIGPTSTGLMSRQCSRRLRKHIRQSEHFAADVHFSGQSWQFLTGVGSGLCCTGADVYIAITLLLFHTIPQCK